MSLRLPNSPMEGLSIDVKKFATDATTFFNRARQYTEEQLGQGEKTQMSPDVEALWKEFEVTNANIMKIKEAVETLLQPNPNLRMEKFVLSKIDTGNQLGRPQDQSPYENLGKTLSAASKPIASSNPMLGEVYAEAGVCNAQIAAEEKKFVCSSRDAVCRPFESFLENDSKTIFKEKRVLETKRLDLDAAKAKLKKVKTLEARDQVEQEVRNLQTDFERQQELLKLLLEGIAGHQSTQMRALTELVDAQANFFQAAASHVSKLQSFVHEKNGGVSTSASFPRRNSANQSVPVSDILKDDGGS